MKLRNIKWILIISMHYLGWILEQARHLINHFFWYYHFFHVFGYAYIFTWNTLLTALMMYTVLDFGIFRFLGPFEIQIVINQICWRDFHLISQFFFSPLFQLCFSECETMSSHCRRILDFSIKLMTFNFYILKPCTLSKHFSLELK